MAAMRECAPAQRIKQKAHSIEWALWLYWEPAGLAYHGAGLPAVYYIARRFLSLARAGPAEDS
ncbi:MAG: hypothetical protein CML20_05910 [Rheinheimera sp.]|nr:hypothetical protein [Rheinheimera sp.]